MTITVGNIEGKTPKKGAKQNKVYSNLVAGDTDGFYYSEGFTIWNVNRDWSLIGISKRGKMRMSYTKDFTIDF